MNIDYLLDLQDKLEGSELEYRLKILPQRNFKNAEKRTITYYRSLLYPNITFRKHTHIESKELVERIDNYYLSIEKSYKNIDFNIPLIETNKRTIYRKRICENPIVEITRCEYEFQLEIEFNRKNYELVDNIIKEYKVPYYPMIKPIEISAKELVSKLNNCYISFKADGLHVLVLKGAKSRVLLHENGYVSTIKNKASRNIIDFHTVYEAELMDDGKLLYFDCHVYNNKDLSNLKYLERRKYIKENKKELWDIKELDKVIYYVPQYKTDGFIITKENEIFKSKFKSTVDLRYRNGYLYLENELVSTRIPKTNYNYINNEIYEFDLELNLVKSRSDKTIANYKFPYENNPLYNIVKGYGIYRLRNYHNYIKSKLLNMLPTKIHLDIGSGKGGDIDKWNKFETIYAVDPLLNLRKHKRNVIEIKDYAENTNLEYDSISIFFVPWNNNFIELINKCNYCVLILMSDPINYKCEQFECKIDKNKIQLKIPDTVTAKYVIEELINKSTILDKLDNFKIKEIIENFELSENENILKSMYKYYYLERK